MYLFTMPDYYHIPMLFGFAATGSDVVVYVIDTGVHQDHVDFGGRATHAWTYPGGTAVR